MFGRFFVKGSCPAVRSAAALASFVAVVLRGFDAGPCAGLLVQHRFWGLVRRFELEREPSSDQRRQRMDRQQGDGNDYAAWHNLWLAIARQPREAARSR